MDIEAFQTDLRATMRKLPPAITEKMGQALSYVFDHIDELKAIGPDLMPLLKSHGMAAFLDAQTGYLDEEGLEKAVRDVFAEFGIKPAGV